MIINLVPYRAPIEIDRKIDIKDLTDGGADQADLKCTVTLKSNGTVAAKGTIQYDYKFDCDACLAPSKKHVVVDFDEVFSKTPNEDQYKLDGDSVDLEPMLIDSVVLSVPLRRLCKEDCKGLCPVCGTDLNERECSCKKDADGMTEGNPFEALKKFGGK